MRTSNIVHRTLLVDVGNTSIALAVGVGGRIVNVRRVATREGNPDRLLAAIHAAGHGRPFTGAALGSVVPRVTGMCERAIRAVCGFMPLVVSHRLKLGIRMAYPKPFTLGADRLANVVGAVAGYGWPVIVADVGTATTFDVVSESGAYVGGVIAPGPALMVDYLAERTALLPRIRLTGAFGGVGRSTRGAMRIGAEVGYRGMMREIVAHLRNQSGMHGVVLCATGGYAGHVFKRSDVPVRLDPRLTLRGLQTIYELNRNDGGAGPAGAQGKRTPRECA